MTAGGRYEPAPSEARRRAHRNGHWAEWAAAAYLQLKGYRVLARRFGGKGGEIDLIVSRGATIAFVEVKARADLGLAETAITPAKQIFMARAARRWLALHPRTSAYALRADAVFVAPWRRPRHVANVFPLALD